jgi:iron complex transport system ATP-binding protein
MIRAADIVVRRAGRNLVDGVSLSLGEGEFMGLVGPNGAGKSTLMRVLAGEFGPEAGLVEIDGVDLTRWRRGDLARRRAVLPQHAAVAFDIDARAIVELGRLPHEGQSTRAQDAQAVDAALDACDAAPLAARGYAALSGGEQQRIQLARALAQIDGTAKPLLLLDEPTSSLDLAHQHAVLNLSKRVAARGGTVLAVLHDLFSASLHCRRIAVLERGRLVADGPPEDALAPDLVRRVFGVDSRWIDLPGGAHALATYPLAA